MRAHRTIALTVAALMALAAVGAELWRPRHHLVNEDSKLKLEGVFPKEFGDWRVDDRGPVQLVSPDQQALINRLYNQTLSRIYVNAKGDRVMLSVAYGGDQSDATRAHRPDVCYPAQGFEIMARGRSVLALQGAQLPVLQMVARLGPRVEPVSYWFVVGERVALSGTDQKLAQLSYTTRGVVPDGLLMRVSTIDSEPQRAYAVQGSFVADLYRAVPSTYRQRVFGAEAKPAVAHQGTGGPTQSRG